MALRFPRKIALHAVWAGAFWATAVLPCGAEISFHFDDRARSWTLRNDLIEVVAALSPEGHFGITQFSDRRRQITWSATAGRVNWPASFSVGGVTYDGSSVFVLASHSARRIARDGFQQNIVLQDPGGKAQFRVDLELYENQPVLRQAMRYRNLTGAQVFVDEAGIMNWRMNTDLGPFRALRVNQWVSGGQIANFEPLTDALDPGKTVTVYSGAAGMHCSWLALQGDGGNGLLFGWEFNGRAVVDLAQEPGDGPLTLDSHILDLHHAVAPGGEFRVPAWFVGSFQGDWDEAAYRTQSFVEAVIAKRTDDPQFPYVMWDSWQYGTQIDEATLRRNAQIAASLGIEVFVIDLGWARQIGEWIPDPKKFPSGMKALSDYVHSLGMKFGLHFPLLEAAATSPALLQNPDWAAGQNDDYFGAVSLCPAHQPVRAYLIAEALRIIDDYGVDWILQDGENMVKRCTKTTHTHDPDDGNYANAVNGLDPIIDEVERRRPAVHWENCEDGGNMMTFAMARRYVTSIAADNSGAMTTRQAIYGVTYPFPVRYSDRYMPDESLDSYATRSYMFGGPWIFMNRLASMKPQDLGYAAAEIGIYKSLRPLMRRGRTYHLTDRPAQGQFDAMESYDQASDSALVFVYRAAAPGTSVTVPVRGLAADRTYTVSFQDSSTRYTMSGTELLEQGVPVTLARTYSAEIVYVRPAVP